MNCKYILIVLILAVIVGGWILWLSTEEEIPPIEETQDETLILLGSLKKETRIDFLEIKLAEFKWNVKKYEEIREVAITGKGFEVEGISNAQYDNIELFFKDRGFGVDLYNVAAGTISELTGYKKEYIVCTVAGGVSGYKEATGQWIPPEIDKKDVEVKCGKGDSSIEHLFSKEELIKKLFAEKYKTKAGAVTIDINKETENHVKGTVQILDPLAEGGAGDRGVFLTAKTNGDWELIEEVEKYNFPEDATIEAQNGDNFFVILNANPTTGFQWELDFDSNFIQLVDRKYTLRSPEIIGSGGDEAFNFLALKSGETEIIFSYLRTWEEKPPIEKKVYEIIIK